MPLPNILRVTGASVLYSLFVDRNTGEDGMPERIMVLHTDHTPEGLRELVPDPVWTTAAGFAGSPVYTGYMR